MTSSRTSLGFGVVFLMLFVALSSAWAPMVPQAAHYHAFADHSRWLGIAHAGDVLSNLGFALGGLWGLWQLARRDLLAPALPMIETAALALFFAGLLLTAVGSGWYHLAPDDHRVLVDRLCMVPAFAGLLSLVFAQRLDRSSAWALLALILLWGVASALLWYSMGNLVPWAALQVSGMLLLAALALAGRREKAGAVPVLAILLCYGLAKLCEMADVPIHDLTSGWLSGHSLKHLLAALAAWPVIRHLQLPAGQEKARPDWPHCSGAVRS